MSDALKSFWPASAGIQLEEKTVPSSFHGPGAAEQKDRAAGSPCQPAPYAVPAHVAESLRRHNACIGSSLQRSFQRVFSLYLYGPMAFLLVHALFKVRVEGRERIARLSGSSILAIRHFYEWDPLLSLPVLLWRDALTKQHLVPLSLAGQFWTRTAFMRAISWLCGIIAFIKGHEPEAGGIRRASELLDNGNAATVTIYPTGPIGQSKEYQVWRGIGYLGVRCPDVPIIPVSIQGLQELHLASWRSLRRPELKFIVGQPFYASEIHASSTEEWIDRIRERLTAAWTCLENGKQKRAE
ncbi:MAG TPA: lysophospholipid acyltransferase family protein [Candidatus Obscuribacterales bacterium]